MFGSGKKPARLGQWDGPKRSSRCDDLVLPAMWQRPVLSRLLIVLAAVLAVTALAFLTGPPMPYRIGEAPTRDLRARVYFEVVDEAQTERLREEVLASTLLPGPQAGRPVQPVLERYPAGMPLVKLGEPITEGQHALLMEEHRAWVRSLRRSDHVRTACGLFLVNVLFAAVIALYVARFQHGLASCLTKITNVCLLVVAASALAFLLARPPWHASLIPLACTALVFTIAYNPPFALLMSFSLGLSINLALQVGVGQLLVQMCALGTAVLLTGSVRTRSRLVEVAAGAGVACVLMTVATEMIAGQPIKLILMDSLRHFLWALAAGFILTGSLPLLERSFGVVTDVSLLELSDGSHPLLQELVRRAPGTYTHSVTVATLAESAAEAIGANPLLVRVGCYFHDIGKMLKPQYFIENQSGSNRHDGLEPAMSTLVIIGHVKDGLALADQYNLPRPIRDFITQHHGTTLVEYFYREALRLQEANGHGGGELEFAFRYPGPKPQSREAGILMLSDCVESASRALSAPTPGSLRKLVHDLMMKRLLDGQFDESGLTLTELHRIEEAVSKSLIALYHSRIRYPEEPARAAS